MLADRVPQWIQEGEARGEANTLLKLLALKFGVLPVWVEQKVSSADKVQLDLWVEQVLTVSSVEEMFL